MATGKIPEDPRIDPRIKALFGSFPEIPTEDVVSREAMLAEANSDEAKAREQAMQAFFEMCDNEDIAPSEGISIDTHIVTSEPDNNSINSSNNRRSTSLRLLHPRRRHAIDVVLLRQLPCLGEDHRCTGRCGSHG